MISTLERFVDNRSSRPRKWRRRLERGRGNPICGRKNRNSRPYYAFNCDFRPFYGFKIGSCFVLPALREAPLRTHPVSRVGSEVSERGRGWPTRLERAKGFESVRGSVFGAMTCKQMPVATRSDAKQLA